jgi:trk system potassium uptake protein TrkH
LNVIGALIAILGVFMLLPLIASFIYQDDTHLVFLGSSAICISIGSILFFIFQKSNPSIGKKEGFAIVALGWICLSLFGSLPYVINQTFDVFSSALFETVSGLTTTGATVITDIEAQKPGMLLWRSLTQWIGGMGIIVLTVAILPLLGVGGSELFVAEAPGPTSNKIHPRIRETAKRLWYIYVGLTFVLAILLSFSGMNYFDAVNHALTTMATGGFSTKNTSIAYFDNPVIEYIIASFMIVAGVNYTIIYFAVKGRFQKVIRSDEFKTYILLLIALIVLVTIFLFFNVHINLEESFRIAIFQIVSIITTTGFVTADYTSWSTGLTILFFGLLFSGACAGSTSGGIKIIRHLVLFKNSALEFKRLLHSNALIRIKIDGNMVPPKILTHILVFLLLYLALFAIGSISLSFVLAEFEQPLLSAMGASATALGNVGPAIADLGPLDNFSGVPPQGKWILIILMLLGRLEIFTVLILITPYFYRVN